MAEKIIYVNSHTTFGPPSNLIPLDVERVVAEWRVAGSGPTSAGGSAGGSAG